MPPATHGSDSEAPVAPSTRLGGLSPYTGASQDGPVDHDADDAEIAALLRRPETLRCVYQPVVDLRTGECSGYEALTRVADWPASSPQPWFAAAARSGLAGELEAATLANALRGRSELTQGQFLAVNIAAELLDDPAVAAVLEGQADLGGLVVELCWADGTSEEATVPQSLPALRRRGALLACDVTGAGRLELDRLHRIGPDLVKLDGALAKGAYADPIRDRLVRLVIGVADELGAVVLAEGLESMDDVRYLQRVGIRMAQGWLFGRARPSFLPVPAEVLSALRTAWDETVASSRVGRLARPVPTRASTSEGAQDGRRQDVEAADGATVDGNPADGATVDGDPEPGSWWVDLDDAGHLIALIGQDGERLPASRLIRLRNTQDLRSAAVRILATGRDRSPQGLVAVSDATGRFVGVTQADVVLREALGAGEGLVPLTSRT